MKPVVKVVPEIKAKGYPVGECGYEQSHEAANREELRRYGKKKFTALKKVIDKKIPGDELAGSHTRSGTILISKKIPEKYHKEIIAHEKFEHDVMNVGSRIRKARQERKRKSRRTKRR